MKLCPASVLAACLLAGSCLAPAPAPAAARPRALPAPVPAAQRVQFEFHSGFLMNLHHFLYDAARHPAHLSDAGCQDPALARAAELYRHEYAAHSLVFDEGLRRVERALSVHDDHRQSAAGVGLPTEVAEALDAAAPAYARCAWPAHDRQNRLWTAMARELDERHGPLLQALVEQALGHALERRVRVDVVFDTGDVNGAYTQEDPAQSVIPSGRPDYAGWAALEMLYHEASHAHATDTLNDAIDAEVQAQGRAPDHGLWHAAQFEAVGQSTRRVLREQAGVDYRPYAQANGVYRGRWAAYRPLLAGPWSAHLDGRETLDQAVHEMVAALPAR